jgi:hypothetical protein
MKVKEAMHKGVEWFGCHRSRQIDVHTQHRRHTDWRE